MRNFRSRGLAVCFALSATAFAPGAARAADANGAFAIRGPGSQSCATFLATRGNPADFERSASWLLGYLTARNRTESATYDILPTEGGSDFANIVAAVCRGALTATLETAANSAMIAIAPLRQSGMSPVVQVIADGRTVSIHAAALRQLQAALIQKKALTGSADGVFSPRLIAALKDYQRKEGIPVTGLPDIDTFIRAIVKR